MTIKESIDYVNNLESDRLADEVGWMIHYVYPRGEEHPSIHTHGVEKFNNLGEIEILFPLTEMQASWFLNTLAIFMKNIEDISDFEKIEDLFNIPFYLFKTKCSLGVNETVYRLIMPDPNEKFPWEKECQELYKKQLSESELLTILEKM